MLSLICNAHTRQPYKMLPDKITRYSMVNKTYKKVAPSVYTCLASGLATIVIGAVLQKATIMLCSLPVFLGASKNTIDTYFAYDPAYQQIKARAKRIKNISASKADSVEA